MEAVYEFAGRFSAAIINPLLIMLFGAGLLVFIWGIVRYLYSVNVKGKVDGDGKWHMLWGLIGMFIMAAALAIIRLIYNTIGSSSIPLPPGY